MFIDCVYDTAKTLYNMIWLVNIGLGNGLVPDGTKPLPDPMLTKSLLSQNTHERHSKSHTWGIGMECPLQVHSMNYILQVLLLCFM